MSSPPPTRWLDDEEREAWRALATVLFLLPIGLDAQLQKDAGLSHFEYQVLSWLSMSPEQTQRMSELAALTNGSLSRLSHVANRLEKQGLLSRRADPSDRRSTLATLTRAGYDKVKLAAPGHVETVRKAVIDPLTKAQVRQLRAIGDRIAAVITEGTAT